jgi:hypothetical protein
VSSAAFSSDGTRVVTGADDGTVGMWDTKTGRNLSIWHAHGESVRSVRLLADGQILSTGDDQLLRIAPCTSCENIGDLVKSLQARLSRMPNAAPAAPAPAQPGLTDELQNALLTASGIGATDGGDFPPSTYPCTTNEVFTGFQAFFGRELDFSDAIVATADMAFTDASGAQDLVAKTSETGCDHFLHPGGDVETTTEATHGNYGGATLKSFLWLQTGSLDLVGYDTYVVSGRVVGFITCLSPDAQDLVKACDPIVQQFVRNLTAIRD